jgi:hypothetical protein
MNNSISTKIDTNLSNVNKIKAKTGKYNKIDRKEFLDLTYEFLVFDTNTNVSLKNYKDLDNLSNIKASYVLNNTTWKDKFGENYYQPKVNMTR